MLRQFRMTATLALRIAAAAAFCVVFGSVFWRADSLPAARTSYERCSTMSDDTQRLGCFDDAFRRHSVPDAGRMSFAEILMGLRKENDSLASGKASTGHEPQEDLSADRSSRPLR